MSIQASRTELDSLTDFQREIHLTKDMNEHIISGFHRVFYKCTWHVTIPAKLKCAEDGDEVSYVVNNSFHFLAYSYMRFVSPPVSVKQEFKGKVRMGWCHNLGTNIVVSASFKEDDDTYHTWDNVWADIYFQFFQDGGAGKRENHNIGIGNVKCLEDWTEYLPAYPLNVEQPWFYSMDQALAFPIFYKNSQTRAEHRYTLRRRVTDLLRVQLLGSNGKWRDCIRGVSKYLDLHTNAMFKTPELWGRYSMITEAEIMQHKCKGMKSFYIRDVEICDTPNPNAFNSNVDITLHCKTPCLSLFWVAENVDASTIHNYSNYTTDPNDLYRGWDPIKATTLKYGSVVKLDNMPSDHFSIAEPRKHFLSAPSERGYHGYSNAWNSTNYDADIGITYEGMGAHLLCKIANNNIYTNSNYIDEDEEDVDDVDDINDMSDFDAPTPKQLKRKGDGKLADTINEDHAPKFITRARLLVIRKFTVSPTDDELGYKFEVK